MNNYKNILILHAVDESTVFLETLGKEFSEFYHQFDSNTDSIHHAKSLLADLEPKSLIIYLGHGSSFGLYEPDESHIYEKYFLNTQWGNHYFEDHDILLISCRSSDFIKTMNTFSSAIGFGNIISSKKEVDFHNEKNHIKKDLSADEISIFNTFYIEASIKVIKLLISDKILFSSIYNYYIFFINQTINTVLLDKENKNRIELARLLFEFRNTIKYINLIF
ncbi:hypothetical protein [Chryseobacterium populi]|uniref:CHAT domain-containing protein n=1 Tax=Chryseobacterium populi TaxID=1144316 RepID=J2K9T9_9FLAO|nr:hypothetical protein [Chryseobacterium populi]EJL69978.1 hypothetical protein PMI13_02986 [Chryseobacterium populi]